MGHAAADKLEILLIADDAVRIAALRERLRDHKVQCAVQRVNFGNQAEAYLQRRTPYQTAAPPDLVVCDLAVLSPPAFDVVQIAAFGEHRSSSPVVLLTSEDSEARIEAGELDGGEATMFIARTLDSFIRKLAGARRDPFLKALQTLYAYGPILVRLPEELYNRNGDDAQLSA